MFEITRTRARWAFKDLLGQANHFLITILVGLNGIRDGSVTINDEFRTSWNPVNSSRSAERSRLFALDLSLVRAVDALDTYMMMTARKPFALPDQNFVERMDGTKRSVLKRLQVFNELLSPLAESHTSALTVAIEWRNRRVHYLAEDRIEKSVLKKIIIDREQFIERYSGLDVFDLIKNFEAGNAPTFKEAATIIRLCHEAVEHFDAHLLKELHLEQYIKEAIMIRLSSDGADLNHVCRRVWDGHKSREKAIRLLRLVGVRETEQVVGREVPDSFVDRFVSLGSEGAVEFLSDSCEVWRR